MVTLLLQAKADAAVVNEDKESAVALAAKHGHEEVVASLLEAGVSISFSGGPHSSTRFQRLDRHFRSFRRPHPPHP